jgi:CelD/BcsL family acetyltransferase involved in cellulose biosynthesis
MPERLPGDLPNPMATAGRARHITNSYETSLPATFSSFSSTRNGTYFKTTRRSRRKLDTLGQVRFMVQNNPNDIIRTVKLLLAQKRRKYGSHYVPPAIMPAFEEFYRRIALTHLQNSRSVAASLCVDDTAVATGFGMLQHKRFYILMLGHETGEWAPLSPGRLFIWELVRWCIEQGVETFDFTIGDEDYKGHWSDRHVRIFENQYPLNAFGAAFLAVQQFNSWRRRSR